MKKSLFLVVVAVACLSFIASAFAEPTCKISVNDLWVNDLQVSVTIFNPGVVWSGGQKPPQGWVAHPGTGKPDDIVASCSDNEARCGAAEWYLRFFDAKQGWPDDSVVGARAARGMYQKRAVIFVVRGDRRAVRGIYKNLAVTYDFTLTEGMKTENGEVREHYSVKIGDQMVAAHQPQGMGCSLGLSAREGAGNHLPSIEGYSSVP